MQLIKITSAAAALVAGVAASEFNKMGSFDASQARVRVINRCPYKVYLWSVLKGQGCPANEGTILETGDFYQENHRVDSLTGVSIKISKTDQCKGVDNTQLEYFIEDDAVYGANYLDVSYVDCLGEECPTRQEGFYLISGNHADGSYPTAGSDNAICPILSCSNVAECSKMAYVLPDDVQTKSCNPKANLDFYMCGGEAPGDESDYKPEPKPSSSSKKHTPQPQPTTTQEPSSYQQVHNAEVTPPPSVEKKPNIKTETKVVYVTEYEYANAKRHEHAHAHAHAHHKFRA